MVHYGPLISIDPTISIWGMVNGVFPLLSLLFLESLQHLAMCPAIKVKSHINHLLNTTLADELIKKNSENREKDSSWLPQFEPSFVLVAGWNGTKGGGRVVRAL